MPFNSATVPAQRVPSISCKAKPASWRAEEHEPAECLGAVPALS
jgi:hypothetical protein